MTTLREALRSAAIFPRGELDPSVLRLRATRRRRRRTTALAATGMVVVVALTGGFAVAQAGASHSGHGVVNVAGDSAPVLRTTTTTGSDSVTVPAGAATATTSTSVVPIPPAPMVTAPATTAPLTAPPVTTPPTASTTTTPVSVAPVDTTPTTVGPVRPSQCAIPPVGQMVYATQAEFEAGITGRWFLCRAPSVFGGSEIGIELLSNHRWKKLTGSIESPVPSSGWGSEGSWEAIDNSDMNGPGSYQLNLTYDGGGTVICQPQISANANAMGLANYDAGIMSDYVRG